jgi:predicted nucleic acid-binding protein
MRLVVDASVGVKWLLDETQSEIAERALTESDGLIAPDLFPIEVASVLTKRLRRGAIGEQVLNAAIREFEVVLGSIRIHSTVDLIGQMIAISRSLHHSLYDCAYLALAEAQILPLLTADAVFVRKTRNTRWSAMVWPLADTGLLLDRRLDF